MRDRQQARQCSTGGSPVLRFFGGVIAGIAVASAAPAQSLRLDDLFTSSTQTRAPLSLSELTPDRARMALDSLEDDIAARRFDDVLDTTELLSAWLDKKSPEYARALWFRARAYEGKDDRERLTSVAQLYLGGFPEGENRGWLLLRIAIELERQKRDADAGVLWREIATKKLPIEPADALRGADTLLRVRDAVSARGLLDSGFAGGASEPLRQRRDVLLLESLLIQDDPAIELPPVQPFAEGGTAGVNLRRALMLEVRGDREGAEALYGELAASWSGLTDGEKRLLDQRSKAVSESPWPPRQPEPKPPSTTGS